jgi:hypothetical protein
MWVTIFYCGVMFPNWTALKHFFLPFCPTPEARVRIPEEFDMAKSMLRDTNVQGPML